MEKAVLLNDKGLTPETILSAREAVVNMGKELIERKLVELFWKYTEDYSWEDWCSMSAGDKESIVVDALVELGLSEVIDTDEAYDVFWEWASGLDEESFSYDDEEDESDDEDDEEDEDED